MISISIPIIGHDEKNAVLKVMSDAQLASGEHVSRFEEIFKDYIGCQYGVCTSSGTTALHAALIAAGIEKDDAVITTPFSFIATANAILYVGAKPLFADVEYDSFNIDPDKIESLIRSYDKKIKALIIVHLFGNPCDMDRISAICHKHNIMLIEDCAQAHGAEYKGKKVGSFGDASIFSFYPTKNITCGEGGIVLTNRKDIYDKLTKIINHGQSERYNHDILGYNFRMTNISAAIGIEQLKKLDSFNSKRIQNAQIYLTKLKTDNFKLPIIRLNTKHVFNQFTVKCNIARNIVIQSLSQNNIGYGVYYPIPIPKQKSYNELNITADYPVCSRLCKEVISIPVHPSLTDDEITHIIDILNSIQV